MAIRMKLFRAMLIILAILFVIGILWYFNLSKEKSDFVVQKGDSASKIADILEENKVITFKKMFIALVKITNSSAKLQAGDYQFSQRDNIFTVLAQLRKGSKSHIKITIPEGNNIRQIAAIIKSKINVFDDEKFIALAQERKLEGYLMPDTYLVGFATTEEEMIKLMRDNFDKKVSANMNDRAKELGMSMKDIITLASIIEKEAMKAEERALIAGVFYNRLKKRIKLESCATVLYAMGINKPNLSLADLKYPSPYNTYLYYGLPPGPITNPGIEAIRAALYPVETNNLFFVAEGGGGHLFSPNLEQHVKNKNEAKVKQRERKIEAQRQAAKRSTVDRKAAEEATRMLAAQQLQEVEAAQQRSGR